LLARSAAPAPPAAVAPDASDKGAVFVTRLAPLLKARALRIAAQRVRRLTLSFSRRPCPARAASTQRP
jgi:hypothetical protein